MKQGFMSIDGKFFTSEAKCKEHELTVGFIMYNEDGATFDPNQALVVTILSESGLKEFCDLCDEYNSIHNGVTGIGNWIWNIERDTYFRLEDFYSKAVVKMYIDKFGPIEE